MTRLPSQWLFLTAFGLVVACELCGFAGIAHADDKPIRVGDPIPQQVLDDWQARRNEYASVYWEVDVVETLAPGFLNRPEDDKSIGKIPHDTTTRTVSYKCWKDFAGRRVRLDELREGPRREDDGTVVINRSHNVTVLNGKRSQIKVLESSMKAPRVTLKDRSGSYEPIADGAFGCTLAYLTPKLADVPDELQPLAAHDCGDLRVHSIVRSDGGTLLTLRAKLNAPGSSYQELVVNLDRGSTVERYAYYYGGKLWTNGTIEWVPLERVWKPVAWTRAFIQPNGEFLTSGKATLREWIVNPPLDDVQFSYEPEPGEIYKTGGEAMIHIGDGVPDVPHAVYRIQQEAEAGTRRWKWIAFGLGAAAVIAVVWSRMRR